MSIWECVQENSFLPLIFSRGKKKSDSLQLPKGLTVGTEPEQIPFVFLALKGPAIVDREASWKTQWGCGLCAKLLQRALPCSGTDTTSPPLSSTPVYLARLSIFPSVYHHSDVLQRQTFLGLLWGKLEAHAGHVQPGESAQTAPPAHPPHPPQVGWEVMLGSLLSLYLGLCPAFLPNVQAPSWCLFGQRRIPGSVLSPFLTQSSSHTHIDPPPQSLHAPHRGFCFCHKIANTSTK